MGEELRKLGSQKVGGGGGGVGGVNVTWDSENPWSLTLVFKKTTL